MKKFNKNIENKKIEIMQNKSTYIKRVSIIFSCVILVVLITLFTFAKFLSNSSEYTLIHGKVIDSSTGDITLSYIVDGVSQSAPPAKGTGYKIKSINCTNAEGTWDKRGWGLYVNNITGKAKCNLEFEVVTSVEVTLYSAALDEVYYYDNNERIAVGTTDATGKLEHVSLDPGDITLYSSVAKNPDNLSQDFSKDFSIDDDSENIYVMPDGDVYYWYGYDSGELQIASTANGWTTHTSYSFLTPTFKNNSIKITIGVNQTSAYGTISPKTYSNATVHYIGTTNVANYVSVTSSLQKTNYTPRTDLISQTVANTVQHLSASLNVDNTYLMMTSHFIAGSLTREFYAFWVD